MSLLIFAEIIFWIFVFLKLVDIFITIYQHKVSQTDSLLDDQLVPILKNSLKAIVILFGAFKFLIALGADPKAIIAGASIGGLAVGLAAQDTVKNLIGTLMIFVDKPFKIGDWINVDGIEGSVEEVGFRSTIIRAADTTIFKVPNSKLAEAAVNNMGKRVYRRFKTTLGIRYDTPPELIEEFVEGVKKIIELHPTTRNYSNYTPNNSAPYNVDFVDYGDSSLNILLNVYFNTKDYAEEMHGRHILLLGILELANSLGVEFAFPSQTLFMELFPEKQPAYPKYNTDPDFVKKTMSEVIEEFKNKIAKY
jgi:MscS family membrane protein